MATVDLTLEELNAVLQWYYCYPSPDSPVDTSVVEKLKAALPVRTVDVALSRADLGRLIEWYVDTEPENDHAAKTDEDLYIRLAKAVNSL